MVEPATLASLGKFAVILVAIAIPLILAV